MGAGAVHHVAWSSPMAEHEEWHRRVARAGLRPSPIIDRFYFRSIYFREPSGVLFEIATLGPGLHRRRAAGVARAGAFAAAGLRASARAAGAGADAAARPAQAGATLGLVPGFIGPTEIIILLVVALLVFGPKRLPEMGRSIGKGMREFKNSVSGKDDDDDAAR